jgi:predicted amidohydrolase YtcJ
MANLNTGTNKADLVLTNGIVYTVDKRRSRTETVAVDGKEIVYDAF